MAETLYYPGLPVKTYFRAVFGDEPRQIPILVNGSRREATSIRSLLWYHARFGEWMRLPALRFGGQIDFLYISTLVELIPLDWPHASAVTGHCNQRCLFYRLVQPTFVSECDDLIEFFKASPHIPASVPDRHWSVLDADPSRAFTPGELREAVELAAPVATVAPSTVRAVS